MAHFLKLPPPPPPDMISKYSPPTALHSLILVYDEPLMNYVSLIGIGGKLKNGG